MDNREGGLFTISSQQKGFTNHVVGSEAAFMRRWFHYASNVASDVRKPDFARSLA